MGGIAGSQLWLHTARCGLLAETLALLVGHLTPGGRIAVFDYQTSDVSSK